MKNSFLIFGKSNLIATKTINFFKKNNHIKSYSSKECNLLKKKDIIRIFKSAKKPFILIIFSSITQEKNSKKNFSKNLEMIKNMVECMKLSKIKKIIYISSIEVYGEMPLLPITENTSINPRNLYGLAKFASEEFLRLNVPKKKLLTLRLPGYYGFGDKYESVVGRFLKSAISNNKITINTTGKELRDFLFVDDFPLILKNLINQNNHGIFNLVSGKSSSIFSIAKFISNLLDKNIKIQTNKKIKIISKLKFKKNRYIKNIYLFKFTEIKEGIKKYFDNLKNIDI
jgi:nucleoside-diphosphate-sugar epimerase